MGIMDHLIRNTTPAPPKVIVYGQPGVGKSTLAAQAKALLIDCEGGADAVPNLTRTPYLSTWPEMRDALRDIATAPELPPVVAVDTLDWMVQRITEFVCIDLDPESKKLIEQNKNVDMNLCRTIGSSHGGWFKARDIVKNIVYRDLLPRLNDIAKRGTAILLLAHAANTKLTTPEGFTQRMATPDLPEYVQAPFIEWADAVLYAHNETPGEMSQLKTIGTNTVLAKNRYSLPPEMTLEWAPLTAAIAANHEQNKEQSNG